MRSCWAVWMALSGQLMAQGVTPAALSDWWKKAGTPQPAVLDPDNQLMPSTRERIFTQLSALKSFTAFLVVMSSPSSQYLAVSGSVDFTAFIRDLRSELSRVSKPAKNPVIIAFALEKNSYIVHGSPLSSTALSAVFTPVKPLLKSRDYNAALPKFVEGLVRELNSPRPSKPSPSTGVKKAFKFGGTAMIVGALIFGFFLLVLLPLLCCCGIFSMCCCNRSSPPPEQPPVGGTWVDDGPRAGQW